MHIHPADVDDGALAAPIPRPYAWTVFALAFALLLSDYMSRQVLNAVFPLLKAAWGLSDTRLGSLSGIVALMVGTLTFPLSVLADRWGRVRSITLMAALWSVATLGCAAATSYGELLVARAFVGVGEAAYGSVGVALILGLFPPHLRSTLTGAFMAGGAFGSVLGMALGGAVATQLGWRASFGAMACLGFALVVCFRLVVTERRIAGSGARGALGPRTRAGTGACELAHGARRAVLDGVGRLRICRQRVAALHHGRGDRMDAELPQSLLRAAARQGRGRGRGIRAARRLGHDRVRHRHGPAEPCVPRRKWAMAIVYCAISFALLAIGFRLSPGAPQLGLLALGMFVVAGTSGPAGAMVANLTPPSIHSPAFATLTLVNNLLGLAPGPLVTGFIADRIGLVGALQIAPLVALASAFAFAVGRFRYGDGLRRLNPLSPSAAAE